MAVSIVKVAPPAIDWFLRRFNFDGITLPPFGIYVRAEKIDDVALLRHERMHWIQYQRLDSAWKFYIKYLWLSLRYGYRNNPMEIEARSANN